MIQEFNFNRVVVELLPIVHPKLWTPDSHQQQKKAKMLQAVVRKVGSKVESVKPGDKVSCYNEGVAIHQGKTEFRIINEYGVAAIQV